MTDKQKSRRISTTATRPTPSALSITITTQHSTIYGVLSLSILVPLIATIEGKTSSCATRGCTDGKQFNKPLRRGAMQVPSSPFVNSHNTTRTSSASSFEAPLSTPEASPPAILQYASHGREIWQPDPLPLLAGSLPYQHHQSEHQEGSRYMSAWSRPHYDGGMEAGVTVDYAAGELGYRSYQNTLLAGSNCSAISFSPPQQNDTYHQGRYANMALGQPRLNTPILMHRQRYPPLSEWLAYLLDHPEHLAYAPIKAQELHCRNLDNALSMLNRPTHQIPACVLRNWERAGKGMGPELLEALAKFPVPPQPPLDTPHPGGPRADWPSALGKRKWDEE